MSGSTTATIRMAVTEDSGEVILDRDDDNNGVADRHAGYRLDDFRTKMFVAETGTDGVTMESDASGGRIGVDTIPGTHPITVGGGAYCDGANWVNASDMNSKENFKAVNGEELLEKIEDLSITQWNYKRDEAEVKHIGPTAQDFRSAFGVGADDKSISTIDPSGIALAAIQQLIKENAELRARIVKLEEGQIKSHAR